MNKRKIVKKKVKKESEQKKESDKKKVIETFRENERDTKINERKKEGRIE